MQIQLGVGNRFASPQPRECPRATIEARQSVGKAREGNAKGLVIEASEPVGASAESYLEASAAGRLGNGELRGQEKWMAQADVNDINCERDSLSTSRHCRQERGRIPGAVVAGLCRYMVEAGENMEAEVLDALPCCGQLVEPPSPLAGFNAKAQHPFDDPR